MPKALWRAQKATETEMYARAELEPGVWVDMLKVDYDQAGIAPAFGDIPVLADYEDTITRRGG